MRNFMKCKTPPIWGAETASWMAILGIIPICTPVRDTMATAAVTTPSPPIWMRIMITILPNSVHFVAVSKTTSPVTQAAEVEVKRASRKETPPLPTEAHGSDKSRAPVKINRMKLSRIIRNEVRRSWRYILTLSITGTFI